MTTIDRRKIGSISVLDVDIINTFFGRDFLPYPFMFAHPSGVSAHEARVEYQRTVPDRFDNGDLAVFRQCAVAYANADIRVACHVQHIPADTPSVRVLAVRHDQHGFLAKQRPDEDVIDIHELSPYLLGPAIAQAAPLDKPGRRARIVIPEYIGTPDTHSSTQDLAINHTTDATTNTIKVPSTDVAAFGTVQSHWRPTRRWGIDYGKNFAAWVKIKDDGEYLYQPDFSEAKPFTSSVLAERIDRLISEDVKSLRNFRAGHEF